MTGRADRVFTVPPQVSFLDALAAGVLARWGDAPIELSRVRVFLPTRRACRGLRDAFLRASEGRALLLPRMLPLGDLDADELAEALERMQRLKYYPRDDMATQRLLRRAERLVGEVSPFQRDQLEAAIDSLEHAMSQGERELVESSRQTLLQTFSALGFASEGDDAEEFPSNE